MPLRVAACHQFLLISYKIPPHGSNMPKSRHRKKGRTKSKGRQSRGLGALMRAAARPPLRTCLINAEWREELFASIIVARQFGTGVAVSTFMADTACLGVKQAGAYPRLTEDEFAGILDRFSGTDLVECAPAFAARLLAGACDYAAALGFKPDPEYFIAKEIFGDLSAEDGTADEPIEYGRDGKPFYIAGPYDNVDMIVNRLTRKLGEEGFH
jgi:hypothetical protein